MSPADDYHHGGDTPLSRTEFWMRVAGASFALWAFMIPIAIAMLRGSFQDATTESARIATQNATFIAEFKQYVLLSERRLTLLEERQSMVLRRLDQIEDATRAPNGSRK